MKGHTYKSTSLPSFKKQQNFKRTLMDFHITREVKPYHSEEFNKEDHKKYKDEQSTEINTCVSCNVDLNILRADCQKSSFLHCKEIKIDDPLAKNATKHLNVVKSSVDSQKTTLFPKNCISQNEVIYDNGQISSLVKKTTENNDSEIFIRPTKAVLIQKRLDGKDLKIDVSAKIPQETPNLNISLTTPAIEYVELVKWHHITRENFDVNYGIIFSKKMADVIFQRLEKEIQYFSGDLQKLQIFGKWHQIPRKWVSHGDEGLTYAFSGTCLPALPWNPLLFELKNIVQQITAQQFNFVLVNRYKDGEDYIGEHRDDEKDLIADAAIVSLSFGASRDFIFKHKDARGPKATRNIDHVKQVLEHGSLIMMNSPTNKYWYHTLPVRKKVKNVRINLTFRKMVLKKEKKRSK